jgi:hypothetical protein
VFSGITLSGYAKWIECSLEHIGEEEKEVSEQNLQILTPFAKISLRKPAPKVQDVASLQAASITSMTSNPE